MRSALLAGACAITAGALAAAWVLAGRPRDVTRGTWSGEAIRATLETVVPAHNDLWFRYVLENRTDSEYRIADESEVEILGRSRSTGAIEPKRRDHVSGEFPLVVPPGRRVHFALIWTGDGEIDPADVGNVVGRLALRSFVLIDGVRRYQIEFPVAR